MAEIITASLEDYLIDGLSFKLSKTASYVTNRRSVTYHPQGSNIYSTNGTKLIKFHISGSDWLTMIVPRQALTKLGLPFSFG